MKSDSETNSGAESGSSPSSFSDLPGKIVQIEVTQHSVLYALAADGSVWRQQQKTLGHPKGEWEKIHDPNVGGAAASEK